MHKITLRDIGHRLPSSLIHQSVESTRVLTIFQVAEIPDLVHLDSEGVQLDYDARIRGATVVYPEAVYDVFLEFTDKVREAHKKGVVYPSARHSRDYCFAFFDDESAAVKAGSFRSLLVTLSLVNEDQDLAKGLEQCNPFSHKLHPTMGHYQFVEKDKFDDAEANGILNPAGIPQSGYVDFVRRRYNIYSRSAVAP